jgi:sugar phosphate isomerase/epimerase
MKLILSFIFLWCAGIVSAQPEIGLQLYSLRDQFPKDVSGTLAKVSAMGITEVELAGTYGLAVPEFKRRVEQAGLKIISTGAEFSDLDKNPEQVARDAKELGAQYVVCFWIPHSGNDFGIADINKAVEVFNRAGQVLKAQGLQLCYHPHGYEFRPYQQGTLFDELVAKTNPDYFNFEMDVFWVKHPGQDPAALLRKYPKRFSLMHLKDRKPGTPGNANGQADVETNVVLGSGDVGIAEVMKAAKAAGVRHFFIEDESSRAEQQIPKSLAYLKTLR